MLLVWREPLKIACFWTQAFMAMVWLVQPSWQAIATSFTPASIPLAVRSPYMSAWYNNTNGSLPLSQSLPVFWGIQVCYIHT